MKSFVHLFKFMVTAALCCVFFPLMFVLIAHHLCEVRRKSK